MPQPATTHQARPVGAAEGTAAGAEPKKAHPPVTRSKTAPDTGAKRTVAFSSLVAHGTVKSSYLEVYRTSPLKRIAVIREGVPAAEAKRLFESLLIGQSVGFKVLNLSISTVNKKAKQGGILSPEESERVVGLAKLVGQLEAMIEESGDPEGFDAGAWMARWLTEPLPAFGGRRPADLIDTMEGQSLVSAALAKVQSGAYS